MFKNNFEKSLNNALVVMKHSYEDVNLNMNELQSHLNYFINDMLQVYILINEKAVEVKSQQERITMNNVDILEQIQKSNINLTVCMKRHWKYKYPIINWSMIYKVVWITVFSQCLI